jgi:DNA-binding transcriptional MocR family regulator
MDADPDTLPVGSWRPWIVPGSPLKSRGIVDALEADIRSGRVQTGARLPPQRAIAEFLGVDLTTVTRAFNEARRRGLVDARAGRGTFVRSTIEDRGSGLVAAPAIDLSLNIPPQPPAARLQHLVPTTMADLLSSGHGMLHLHYQESTGSVPDRAAAARWLARRVDDLQPGSIVVASGAQSALFGICECLIAPGQTIASGLATYPGVKAIARQRGYQIVPLAMDESGIIPESFEDCCRRSIPKAIYVIPSIDNPTRATLPEDRRRRIAAIARQHGVAIIEDDPYSPLLDAAPASFARLAPDLTWHIATLSKCATPALRIAYVCAPGDAQAMRLAGVLRAVNLMAPPLNAAVASRWIVRGVLDEIRQAIRSEAAGRQKIARSVLGHFEFAADPHGHHLWLRMPPHWHAADLAEHAARLGIAVVPSSAFAVAGPVDEAVRISLGAAPDRLALTHGLKRLSELLERPMLPARAII